MVISLKDKSFKPCFVTYVTIPHWKGKLCFREVMVIKMKYTGDFTKEISFPLGGIGTGSIGLGGNGRLMDWEIFNRPSKGSINGYSHFAIKAIRDDKPVTYVINGDLNKDFVGQYKQSRFTGYGFGPETQKMCGFPHFKYVEFDGQFPIAVLRFQDEGFPADVKMTAFNPFIPCDSKNSSIPAAFFEIEVHNTTDAPVNYQIAFSVANPYERSHNQAKESDAYHMLTLSNASADQDRVEYGDLTIATDCETTYTQTYWYRGGWQDNIVTFWNDFNRIENLRDRNYDTDGRYDIGTIAAEIKVFPGKTEKVRFVLSWNVPNTQNDWNCGNDAEWAKPWKNYYASIFNTSVDSACYSLKNWDDLYHRTLLFKEALYNASLPQAVIDAAASNLSVLKSPTVLRLEDGSFYGWEGVHENAGSCEGTCQHVWNYAYAMCFLFPDLERSIRDLEFGYSTDENGRMGFRFMLPVGRKMTDFRACVDGQMGAVVKCYREWKISGDHQWLAKHWNNIKKVLEYAWSDKNPDCWDLDKDGVLEGRQHHTLDMELFGPSSWLEGMYLAALKAAAEMGEFLGDTEKAHEYRELFEKGYQWSNENLFNGRYFIQRIDITDKTITDRFSASDTYWNEETGEIKYQIADGSSIDQMLAQWHADIIGLGDIFDREKVVLALREMMKHNYKRCMRDFTNPWRVFSLNDEAGSVICDYPDGVNKPKIPIPYCEETMTGFEYAFGGLLCSNAMIDDGIKVVSAVRDRFDGKKRNPWNEFECGSNYARSMASYALIPILNGFAFDLPHRFIGFDPYRKDHFRSIWSVDGAWGEVFIDAGRAIISIIGGDITLSSLGVTFFNRVSSLNIDGKHTAFRFEKGILYFDEVKISQTIEIIV